MQGTSEMGDLASLRLKKKIRVTFYVRHSTQKLASAHGLLSQFFGDKVAVFHAIVSWFSCLRLTSMRIIFLSLKIKKNFVR